VQLWDLYQSAKTWKCRPSEIMNIQDDPFAAYCLDIACAEWGKAIENALGDVEGKTKKEVQRKSEQVLRKWLGLPQQFRDPARSGHVQKKSAQPVRN
jgi:broad specificity phosphatase PhoE